MKAAALLITLLAFAAHAASALASAPAAMELNVGTARVVRLDTLPVVDNEFSRRYKFDSFTNPKLEELRNRYHLHDVVRSGADEFDQQVRLMDWVHHRFTKFGKPSTNAPGALRILGAVEEGHTFFCAQYAQVLVSAAASLGWVDRELALRRHRGVARVGGSTEHSTTEIWSNQHRKWVMLDPTSNLYLERGGVPLNAFEIREEWFYRDGTNLVFVVGKERKRYRKADLPIVLQRFRDFGDLAVHPDELDKYGFIGYIPNTDLMDAREDYGNMFITRDALCDGTQWHTRVAPSNPAVDPYFPIGQAALSLSEEQGRMRVAVKTLTPNFWRYESRMNGGAWTPCESAFTWPLSTGTNDISVRTINRFGVAGPVSTAVVVVSTRR